MYYLHTRITLEGREEVHMLPLCEYGEYLMCDTKGSNIIVEKEWLLENKRKVANMIILPTGEIDCIQGWVSPIQKRVYQGTKVVNADGSLKICYLGLKSLLIFSDYKKYISETDLEHKEFDSITFSDSVEEARKHGKYLFPCFLLIRNPINLQDEGNLPLFNKMAERYFNKPFVKYHINSYIFQKLLKEKGYDGATWVENGITYYLPFSGNQHHLINEKGPSLYCDTLYWPPSSST